jgi:hypothetical protein
VKAIVAVKGNSATDWSRASCALLREKIINISEVNGILVDDLLEIPQAALILADYETIVLEPIDFEKYFHFEITSESVVGLGRAGLAGSNSSDPATSPRCII